MGTCFLYGNGGDGNERNIFVKAYASKDALLKDAPKSNTIGIVTSVNIYAMAIQPSAPGNTEGNVWVKDNATAWQKPVIQTIASTSSPKIYVPVFPSECSQYVSGKWVKKTAYLYQSGKWTQFSKEFAATIEVTYPSGSTCTASCGNLEYEAPDTTGSWTFTVPVSGTWTISITNGTNTSSRNVSITTSGQSESVSISYIYYIINASGTADYTGGWTSSGNTGTGRNGPPPGEVEGGVSCVCSAWGDYTPAGEGVVTTNDYIDLTGFTKLTASVDSFVDAGYQNKGTICIIDSSGSTVTSATVNKTATTVTIDFSGLGNSYKIAIKSGRGRGKDGGGDKVGYIVSMMSLE